MHITERLASIAKEAMEAKKEQDFKRAKELWRTYNEEAYKEEQWQFEQERARQLAAKEDPPPCVRKSFSGYVDNVFSDF